MNREEAARILDPSASDIEFEKDISHWSERLDIARAMGAEALRSPWVKTADRLPDAEQIARNDKIFLLCKQHDGTYEAYTHWADGLASHPEKFEFDYWMPVPPLPEVEG